MDQLEQDLRSELSRQVATTPQLPGLVDAVVRRGRRARRRRAAAGTTAVVALIGAVALAGTSLGPLEDRRQGSVAAAPAGPPAVPLAVLQGEPELVQWVDGVQSSFPLGELLPVAVVPDGVLLQAGLTLDLLAPGADATTRVVSGLDRPEAAVSADGRRVTVLKDKGLQEVEVSTGRVLRSVPLTRLFGPLRPITYSGDAVLLIDDQGRTLLWEGNDDGVLSVVFDAQVLDGAGTGPGPDPDSGSQGLVALLRADDPRCGTDVLRLVNGDGALWRLCGERFAGFSPDGSYVLGLDAPGTLTVRDANDGDERRTFSAPGGLRAQGWEDEDTLLYTTLDGDRTIVVRCSVRAGSCRTATSFPGADLTPQPVRPAR